MIITPLQITVTPDAEQLAEHFSADSVQARAIATIEHIATTDAGTLLTEYGGKAISFGLKVLAALVIYLVGAWLIRKVKGLMRKSFARKGTDAAVASFATSLVSISLTALLVIVTIGTLGVNTSSLAGLLAGGGVALGMALNGTVQNFAGGLMLMAYRPFKAGDYIVAQGFSGTVREVTLVNTKLTTPDNRLIIIPNGILSNGTIDNYSQLNRRLEWKVTVEYGSDSDKVRSVILAILKGDSRILDSSTPGAADPMVALNALNDSNIEFIARGWTAQTDYWDVFFAVNDAIYKQLPQHGIDFPFPQLDVHIQQ